MRRKDRASGRRRRTLACLAAAGVSLLAALPPAARVAATAAPLQEVLSRRLPVAGNEVALTFDDGPLPTSTPRILALLRSHHAHATFFALGTELERHPGLAVAAAADGNELGDHGMTHRALPKLGNARLLYELRATADLIQELTGRSPTFIRPPYGSLDRRVIEAARSLHMTVALWTIDTLDWQNPGAGVVARRVLQAVQPGDIVLMHDGGGPRDQTVQAVRLILAGLEQRGYQAVTLSQLVQDATRTAPQPPTKGKPDPAKAPEVRVYGGPCGA
jgi:peptidoglycan/xylan/chitin deacetylase (PgdA/CDA1 family)